MNKFIGLLLAGTALVVLPDLALSQTNPSPAEVRAEINSRINSNGAGQITGASLNSVMNYMVDLTIEYVASVAGKSGNVILFAADISNATAIGIALMTAVDAAAARTAIGALGPETFITPTFTGGKATISGSAAARLDQTVTGAAADTKTWTSGLQDATGTWKLSTVADNGALGSDAISCNRSGTTVTGCFIVGQSVSVDQYKLVSDTSDCESFQRAYAAQATKGGTITLSAKKYTLGTLGSGCQIHMNTASVNWQGLGTSDTNQNVANEFGSWVEIVNPAGATFLVDDPKASGSQWSGIAFSQAGVQTTPGGGWTPQVFPPVISLSGNLGGITVRDVLFYAVYQGILVSNASRVVLDNVRGQVFNYLLSLDQSNNSKANNIQLSPFWSANVNVLSHSYTNMNGMVLAKTVGTFVDNYQCSYCLSAIKFTGSGSGVSTRTHLGKVGTTSGTYGLYWDPSAIATQVDVDQLDSDHMNDTVGGTTSVPASMTLKIDALGINNQIRVGLLRSNYAGLSVIGNAGAQNNRLDIGQMLADRWGNIGGGDVEVLSVDSGANPANFISIKSSWTQTFVSTAQASANNSQITLGMNPLPAALTFTGGSAGSATLRGSQYGGIVNLGSASGFSNFIVTFGRTLQRIPTCTVSPSTSSVTLIYSAAVTTTAITFTYPSNTISFSYSCVE